MTVEEVQMGSATWAVALNLVLRTLPMVLLVLALGLILKIIVQEWQAKTMTPLVRRFLPAQKPSVPLSASNGSVRIRPGTVPPYRHTGRSTPACVQHVLAVQRTHITHTD